MFGDAGNDFIGGGTGVDTMTGGSDTDVGSNDDFFGFLAGDAPIGADINSIDRITDFEQDNDTVAGADDNDTIDLFGAYGGAAAEYAEAAAVDYNQGILVANDAIAVSAGAVEVVAVQVGADTVLYWDSDDNNTVDQAILLVGVSTADLDLTDVV